MEPYGGAEISETNSVNNEISRDFSAAAGAAFSRCTAKGPTSQRSRRLFGDVFLSKFIPMADVEVFCMNFRDFSVFSEFLACVFGFVSDEFQGRRTSPRSRCWKTLGLIFGKSALWRL